MKWHLNFNAFSWFLVLAVCRIQEGFLMDKEIHRFFSCLPLTDLVIIFIFTR